MLAHFNKLRTPIRSVATYPSISLQHQRFSCRGWVSVRCWSLWDAWADPEFFDPEYRRSLDSIEPFDEWEELALFGTHYVLLHATTDPSKLSALQHSYPPAEEPRTSAALISKTIKGIKSHRRFGAGILLRDVLGNPVYINSLGLGKNGRPLSFDMYRQADKPEPQLTVPENTPSGRMCHTTTDLGQFGVLLSGGRTSPATALSDCWILRRGSCCWERAADLPTPLYRHAVTRLGQSSLCLLAGGKMDEVSIFGDFLVYHPLEGWLKCVPRGQRYNPTFGNSIWCFGLMDCSSTKFAGLLLGGMLYDGTISSQILQWQLDVASPRVSFLVQETPKLVH